VLALALVLPAAALAAITRTLSQFILVAIGLGGVAAMLQRTTPAWFPVDAGRSSVVVAVMVVAAGLILFVQYTRRRNRLSQSLAVAAVISSVVLFLYLSEEATFRLCCTASGNTYDGLAIRVASNEVQPPFTYTDSRRIAAPIPVTVDGIPRSAHAIFKMLEFEVVLPSGERWTTVTRGIQSDPAQAILGAGLHQPDDGSSWLTVHLFGPARRSVRAGGVTLRGKFAATLYREGTPVTMSVHKQDQPVPGLGLCSSMVIEGYHGIGRRMMKVVCESPRRLPVGPRVGLQHQHYQWRNFLGDSGGMFPYPTETPLSPLYRLQTFFHVTEKVPSGAGMRWVVPGGFLDSSTILITPREAAGCGVVSFEFRNLDLSRYVAPTMP
jgi:hypothetical protein